MIGCGKDRLDFAPQAEPNDSYSFKVTPAIAYSTAMQYNLINVTKQAAIDEYGAYTFMMKGKDEAKQADVYITGRVKGYDASYINIAIKENGETTFYKDCNNFYCLADTASNAKGSYLQLSDFNNCLTTTLDSDRAMNIITFSSQLNPMTFYLKKD